MFLLHHFIALASRKELDRAMSEVVANNSNSNGSDQSGSSLTSVNLGKKSAPGSGASAEVALSVSDGLNAFSSPITSPISTPGSISTAKVLFPGDPDFEEQASRNFSALQTSTSFYNPVCAADKKKKKKKLYNPFDLGTENGTHSQYSYAVDGSGIPTGEIELCVECRQHLRFTVFGYSRPFVVLFAQLPESSEWTELDRTERSPDAFNPKYVEWIRMRPTSAGEHNIPLCLSLFEGTKFHAKSLSPNASIGNCHLTIQQVLSNPQMTLEANLQRPRGKRPCGVMTIAALPPCQPNSDEEVCLEVGFRAGAPTRNRMFFVVSRAIQKGRFAPVYRSEIQTKKNLNFEGKKLPLALLYGDDPKRQIRIEMYRYYKKNISIQVAFCQTSFLSLKNVPAGSSLHWWTSENGLPNSRFVLENCSIVDGQYSFVLKVAPVQ